MSSVCLLGYAGYGLLQYLELPNQKENVEKLSDVIRVLYSSFVQLIEHGIRAIHVQRLHQT